MIIKTTWFHGRYASKEIVRNLFIKISINCARLFLIFILLLSLTACGFLGSNRSGKSYVINGKRYHILASAEGFKEKGLASWYGEPFHGRKTASGEVYDMNKISAAHKTLPLQTWVEVRNLENNKSLTMRVNDRGPFVRGRIIDLSRAAAEKIGLLNAGVAQVSVKAITGERARRLSASEGRGQPPRVAASGEDLSLGQMAAAGPSTAPAAGGESEAPRVVLHTGAQKKGPAQPGR